MKKLYFTAIVLLIMYNVNAQEQVVNRNGKQVTVNTPASSTTSGLVQLTNELGGTATSPTITNAAVIGKVLTGFASGAGTLAATDNILQAFQKLDGNVALRELLANKSTATDLGAAAASDINYPSQLAVKTYVDAQITSNATPDATATVKGKLQLSGDLAGASSSATSPKVSGLQGTAVSTTAPSTGQLLRYNGTSWTPTSVSAVVSRKQEPFSSTIGQTSFAISNTPIGDLSFFINGVRVANAAVSISGTTVTYIPTNNSNYTLVAGDVIVVEYIY